MKEYSRAARQYSWIIDNAPKSQYFEKATLNTLLALEKQLPTAPQIKKIVGESKKPIKFTKEIHQNAKKARLR